MIKINEWIPWKKWMSFFINWREKIDTLMPAHQSLWPSTAGIRWKEHHWFFKHPVDFCLVQAGSVCFVPSLLQHSFPSLQPSPAERSECHVVQSCTRTLDLLDGHLLWHISEKQNPLGREQGQWWLLGHVLGRAQACLQHSRSVWNRSSGLFGVVQEGRCFDKWPLFTCSPTQPGPP